MKKGKLNRKGNPMKHYCIALLAAFTICAGAADLTTKSGKVYTKYSVDGPSVKGLVIFHELGAATIPYADLPDDLRAKYKADEEKAAAEQKAQEEQRKKLEEQRQAEAKRQVEIRERWEKKKAEEDQLKAQQEAEKEKQRKADAEKGIFTIPQYINDAYGVSFGRSLLSEIRRFENSSGLRAGSGFIGAGSFPHYCFEPEDPFTVTKEGKKDTVGNYYVLVTGKDRIAYMVAVEDIPSKYANDILSILKKEYGDFYFPKKSTRQWKNTIKLVSEKNQDRTISVSIDQNGKVSIIYYCKDIEEKYKEKDIVSVGR